jgi:FixJ family two-component response regulator
MSGLELMAELETRHNMLPIIILTGHGDIPMTVQAIKRGAFDFLQKPFDSQVLLDTINAALLLDRDSRSRSSDQLRLRTLFESLTPREMDVMKLVVVGESSKSAGKQLGISSKTVDIHRASVLKKLKVKNIAELIQAWMTVKCSSR